MHKYPVSEPPPLTTADSLLAAALFLVTALVLWCSPITYVNDSRYSLLLTQTLLSRGTFLLDGYSLPRQPPLHYRDFTLDGDVYQLELVGDHLYSYFPPGNPILSAPFVAVADAFGYSVVRRDGTYNVEHEERLQAGLAALLMAGLAVSFYFTARLLLPGAWSAFLALGGILGTQVWSTASRALWTHTWGIALLGFAVYLLAARETGRRKLNPVLLATVLSWTYFVRPTNSIFILGFTVYVLLFHRSLFLAYAATGAAWFAGFVTYAWVHFHKVLPSYYQANRLEVTTFREAFLGNLVSPSRGVLVFAPVCLFVVYLVVRFWPRLRYPRLVWLTAGVSVFHLLAVSCFTPWFGGGCYGPRYTTELVPWFMLLAILGTNAALSWRDDYSFPRRRYEWRATLAAGSLLLFLSVCINARGAISLPTALWNQAPVSIDVKPSRVWDWRYPQILAGLIGLPPPAVFPPLPDGQRVAFGQNTNRAYLLDGWSGGDADYCWSIQNWTTLIFSADHPSPARLRLYFGTFVPRPKVHRQHITILLNGRRLAAFASNRMELYEYDFDVPAGWLQPKNMLTFKLPDAISPAAVGGSNDHRPLGLAMSWIELDRAGSPASAAGKP